MTLRRRKEEKKQNGKQAVKQMNALRKQLRKAVVEREDGGEQSKHDKNEREYWRKLRSRLEERRRKEAARSTYRCAGRRENRS